MPKAEPFNLVFPVKGLHTGVGFESQPPGTTPDASNVRGYDALKRRLRGGRRAGTSKFYSSPINGSNVIQAIAKTVQGTAYVSQNPDNEPLVAVDDNFSSYTQTTPTYLGSNWVYQDMLATTENGNGVDDASTRWGVDANGLVFDNCPLNIRYILVPERFRGPNDVTATLRARTRATSASTNTGAADDCQCFGPFIRGNSSCHSFIFACLIRNASDSSVILQIIYKSYSGGETLLAQSSAISLLNSATITDNLQISLSENLDTNLITARVVWPGGGAAGADIDQTVTVTDTTNNVGKRRSGVGVYLRANFAIAGGTKYRTVKRIVTSHYNTPLPAVAYTFDRADAGINRYYVPSGVTAVRFDSAGAGSKSTNPGPYDSNSIPSITPYLDTSIDTFVTDGNTLTRKNFFMRQDATTGGGPFNPEIRIKGGLSSGGSRLQFALRFDATYSNGIAFTVVLDNPSATYATTGVFGTQSLIGTKITANDDTSNYVNTSNFRTPVHRDSVIRVQDDGATLTLYIDNHVHETNVATTDYVGNEFVGAGAIDDSAAGSQPSIIQTIIWRQKPDSAAEDLPLGTVSTAKLLIASGGSIYGLADNVLSSTVNGTNAVSPERFQVMMQSAYNRTFIVDGNVSKYYNLDDNTVSTWVATAGTLPSKCRLVALYHGRLVLAGKVDDPHNWFMSKLGDPFDWDYSPATPTVIQAVAGNNADAGLVGDLITALIPMGDDVMLFGGDHTIYKMTGDPAAGGTIDEVSTQTGVAFGRAWAKDPQGTVYFWGTDGVYRYAGVGQPENMTKGRIDEIVRNIDLNFNRIYFEWDYLRDSLLILIVPSNINDACRVIVWERRIDAWWEDAYPVAHGPHCLFAYDTPSATDKALIMGGRDSYLRKIDETAETDDGTAIASHIRFEPFIAPTRLDEIVIESITPVLGSGSDSLNLNIYTGQTAEECVLATRPRVRRLLELAGRNVSVRQRVRGYAVQLEWEQTEGSRWAMEGLAIEFKANGRPRKPTTPDA